MTEICSIIHKCTIHGEKNYMNLDFSSPLTINQSYLNSEMCVKAQDPRRTKLTMNWKRETEN